LVGVQAAAAVVSGHAMGHFIKERDRAPGFSYSNLVRFEINKQRYVQVLCDVVAE
jgi:hypothetical protein